MRSAVFLITVSLAAAACSRGGEHRAVSAKDAGRLLIDRNWLDRWPQHKDDHLLVYRFVPSMGGGVYQDRTVFKGTFELFQFAANRDGALELTFPYNDQKVRAHYRIERVRGPEPFDLKLTISPDPRGTGVYYGMTSDRGQDVQALVEAHH